MADKFKLILKQRITISENTHHFIFATDLPEGLQYKAGQFISLHIEKDGKDNRRNYSIANSPNNNNTIELAMSYLPNGLASTLLLGLNPGDAITASGPYGQFVLKDETLPQRYIFIGTGTGITPYRSMLSELDHLLTTTKLQVVILEGVRTSNDLLYGEEFVNFVAKHQNASFKACYSRGSPVDAKEFEVAGYVQEQLDALQVVKDGDIAYLCGNPNMVDAAFEKLQELGLDRVHIRREKYISSK